MTQHTKIEATDSVTDALMTTTNENLRTCKFLNTAAKTADFTVWDDDDNTSNPSVEPDVYFIDATSGNVTATLPLAADTDAAAGRPVTFFRVDSSGNTVTVDANGSETINGSANFTLAQYASVTCIARTSSDWAKITS